MALQFLAKSLGQGRNYREVGLPKPVHRIVDLFGAKRRLGVSQSRPQIYKFHSDNTLRHVLMVTSGVLQTSR